MEISYTYGHNLPARWGQLIYRRNGNHILACPPIPVRRMMAYDENGVLDYSSSKNYLPFRYVEMLEQNQELATCCRHPENHTIEAWYTNEEDAENETPDLYILTCTCGRRHYRLCCAGGYRAHWDCR